MEFNLGYEVRETRQMSCMSLLSPEYIVEGLNSGKFVLSSDRTAILSDGTIVAHINADEALCGTDYNLPRDFTHES